VRALAALQPAAAVGAAQGQVLVAAVAVVAAPAAPAAMRKKRGKARSTRPAIASARGNG
jgi:hypothetical protein